MGGRDGDDGRGGVDVVCEGTDAVGEALMGRGRRRERGGLSGGVGG